MMERPTSQLVLRWHLSLLCAALVCCGCSPRADSPGAPHADSPGAPHADSPSAPHADAAGEPSARIRFNDPHYPAQNLSQTAPSQTPALEFNHSFPLPPSLAGSNNVHRSYAGLRSSAELIDDEIVSLAPLRLSEPQHDGLASNTRGPVPNIVRLPDEQDLERTPQRTEYRTIEHGTAPPVSAVTELTSESGKAPSRSRYPGDRIELPRGGYQYQKAIAIREAHRHTLQRLPEVSQLYETPVYETLVDSPVVDDLATDVSLPEPLDAPALHTPRTDTVHREAGIVQREAGIVQREAVEQFPRRSEPAESREEAEETKVEAEDTHVRRVDPMRAVNERAEAMIRNGFSLAQRGASFSARTELIEAMRIVAEALDLRDNTRRHSEALKRGFKAIEEAKDFQQRGLAADLDMQVLVAGHQTPALKRHDLSKVTPLVGLQQYFTYAQEQLAIAGGEQATSSVALYGIGRLQGDMQAGERTPSPQAIVFHQAAVMVDGMNYKAANELGVLLARYGQFEQAREMLAHSVRVCPHVESWRNLAKVHGRLGEHELARRAAHESQLASRDRASRTGGADASVRWVDPAALAGTIGPAEQANVGQVARPVERIANPPQDEATTRNVSRDESEGIMQFIPWMRRGE